MFSSFISWIFWVLWLVLFLVYELSALITKNPQATLSYKVWTLEGKKWTFVKLGFAAGLVWLFFHFVFGLFTWTGVNGFSD